MTLDVCIARGHDRITLNWDGWPAEHWVSPDGGVNFVGEADKGQREPQGRAGKEYIMYDFKPGEPDAASASLARLAFSIP